MHERKDKRYPLPVALLAGIIVRLKRWYRRRKVDARIIRQAKAAGVWDKQPIVLGGRALELKAWKDFKIKREPGETDIDLRVRYTMKKIEEHFKVKWPPKNTRKARKDMIRNVKRIAEKHGYKDVKVKTDGYNVEVTLCDETVPGNIEIRVRTETGGQENGVDN